MITPVSPTSSSVNDDFNSATKSIASLYVVFIFQLPATIFLLMILY